MLAISITFIYARKCSVAIDPSVRLFISYAYNYDSLSSSEPNAMYTTVEIALCFGEIAS